MRFVVPFLAILLISANAGNDRVWAEETPPTLSDGKNVDAPPTKAERIDLLFETLMTSDDRQLAEESERAILKLWHDSGSDTVDLLMSWALDSMQDKRYPRALDFLDRIVLMQPDYIEGWNKRATVYFLMEDYGRSISDIGRVLELEPRHFGALSGFGIIMRSLGDKERAMVAYRRALEVDPILDDAREALEALEAETAGETL